MRAVSLPYASSNRHSSTRTACIEKTAKLVPWPSHVAPSGSGRPGQTVSGISAGSYSAFSFQRSGLHVRQGGERNGQPLWAIVQLVEHFVRGLLELQRRERRL